MKMNSDYDIIFNFDAFYNFYKFYYQNIMHYPLLVENDFKIINNKTSYLIFLLIY